MYCANQSYLSCMVCVYHSRKECDDDDDSEFPPFCCTSSKQGEPQTSSDECGLVEDPVTDDKVMKYLALSKQDYCVTLISASVDGVLFSHKRAEMCTHFYMDPIYM